MSDITCASCGILFSVPQNWEHERRRRHDDFWCPNGHSLAFNAESNEEKLRRERNQLRQRLAQKDDEIQEAWGEVSQQKRIAAAQKGNVTKLKKRAAAGVCPCCNRTFQNLKRHMDGQHPNYTDGPELKVLEGGKSAG